MSHWENGSHKDRSDECYTPKYVMEALNVWFDTDAASPVDRTHCCVTAKNHITEDSLSKEWTGFTWCNPPYGKKNSVRLWLEKMWKHGNGIVLTADRTSAPWWQEAANKCDMFLLVNKKIRFIGSDGKEYKSKPGKRGSPSNGSTLFAYGDRACRALRNAEAAGLGKVFKAW